MASLFKQLLFSNGSNSKSSSSSNGSSNSKTSRRKSEIVTTIYDLTSDSLQNDTTSSQRDRRHSIPETGISSSKRDMRALDTIHENDNLTTSSGTAYSSVSQQQSQPQSTVSSLKQLLKSPINMNISPTQRNSPKEKRTFTFFRSRTLSSSSNESNNGVGSGGGGVVNLNNGSTSPRLSPRSLFDRVRKRSQSDALASNNKSPQSSIEQINQQKYQESLQLHLQQQLYLSQQKQHQQQQLNGSSFSNGRKLHHSISEEKDETHSALSSNDFNNNGKSQWPSSQVNKNLLCPRKSAPSVSYSSNSNETTLSLSEIINSVG